MYSFLDTEKYEGIYFDEKSVPIRIQNDMDKNVDNDHFFQSFIYIFSDRSDLQIDIIKEIYKHLNDGARIPDKKFTIQTNRQNMRALLSLIYLNPASRVIGDKGVKNVLQTLNRSYRKPIDINQVLNEIRDVKGNSEEFLNKIRRMWLDLGFNVPGY